MTHDAAYWEKRALDYRRPHRRLQLVRALMDRIPRSVTSVLDVGCGPASLRGLLPNSVEYFGADFAAALIASLGDPAHFETVDLNAGPQCFGARRFDVIVCSGIFEYVRDPAAFLRFLETKVEAGGYLILTYTNAQHYRSIPAMLRGQHPEYADPHYNFASIAETVRLLAEQGFTLVARTAITAKHKRRLPLLSRVTRFPLCMLNRQYLFLCAHEGGPAGGSAPATGVPRAPCPRQH